MPAHRSSLVPHSPPPPAPSALPRPARMADWRSAEFILANRPSPPPPKPCPILGGSSPLPETQQSTPVGSASRAPPRALAYDQVWGPGGNSSRKWCLALTHCPPAPPGTCIEARSPGGGSPVTTHRKPTLIRCKGAQFPSIRSPRGGQDPDLVDARTKTLEQSLFGGHCTFETRAAPR
jgi:hypothetical protein